MFLYHLTLGRPTAITAAIYGNFSAPKIQEIVVSRGRVLELLRPDENGRMQTVYSTDIFGVVRSLQPFRFPGGQQDFVICGSDSGRIVILQYSTAKGGFQRVHQETFGKSGVRRIVPGQYLAVDPKGRACMIAAIEKTKFVYVLNRDNEARLTISSPLEAHRSRTLVYSIVGLDMGFDNPVFAALELDYGDVDEDSSGAAAAEAQKHLTLYELDLGLNHVVRKESEPVDNGANLLIAVPGGGDGPGGVLVCAENFVVYRDADASPSSELRAVVPRRGSLPAERGVLLTAAATHKQKGMFFALVQSEHGDLYKVTLEHAGERVVDLRIKYFDTVPPAAALCVLRKGFLFAASEFGDHRLYQFRGLGGDEDPAPEASASSLVADDEGGFAPVFFEPRRPVNLDPIDAVPSLAPVIDLKLANLAGEEVAQLYAACGRGERSTLRALRPGLALAEMAVSPLPGRATAVFTLRASVTDEHDAYIVVSFADTTLILGVGDTVEEATDTGFAGTVATLGVARLADGSALQCHANGLRHVKDDGRVNEWRPPGGRAIARFAANARQVLLVLAGGDLLLFELNAAGQLVETEKRPLGGEVASLALAPLGEGRARAPLVAVGLVDGTLRVLGLDAAEPLKALATQALGAAPESLLVLRAGAGGGLALQVGLSTGILLRTEVDEVTGALSDTRSRFLGTRAPRLCAVELGGEPAMLALSSRPWVGYRDRGRFALVPATYGALDAAAPFASEQCPEGFVAVAGGTLRVLAVERLGQVFDERRARLRYTPRCLLVHPERRLLVTVEADHQAIGVLRRGGVGDAAPADEIRAPPFAASEDDGEGAAPPLPGQAPPPPASPRPDAAGQVHALPASEIADEDGAATEEAEFLDQVGVPAGVPGDWASCVRVVDALTLATTDCVELPAGEAALCAAFVTFEGEPGPVLAVGVARGLRLSAAGAGGSDGGAVHVYRLADDGRGLRLAHTTPLDGVPRALAALRGRLLAGVGAGVHLFAMGKKRLLRKAEFRALPSPVARLVVDGNRVCVGDASQGVLFLKYRREDDSLYAFADDSVPRSITALLPLDYDTVVAADRYGNVCTLRLPPAITEGGEEDPTAGKFSGLPGLLGGTPHKLVTEAVLHVGETVTALQRGTLQPGGREAVIYATLLGAVGVLYPFASKEDLDFFQHLELHMRAEAPPLLGRDHLAYRSSYFPVRDVIDGDLCEQYTNLPVDKQRQIASELDRTPGEVMKKLEDIRNRIV